MNSPVIEEPSGVGGVPAGKEGPSSRDVAAALVPTASGDTSPGSQGSKVDAPPAGTPSKAKAPEDTRDVSPKNVMDVAEPSFQGKGDPPKIDEVKIDANDTAIPPRRSSSRISKAQVEAAKDAKKPDTPADTDTLIAATGNGVSLRVRVRKPGMYSEEAMAKNVEAGEGGSPPPKKKASPGAKKAASAAGSPSAAAKGKKKIPSPKRAVQAGSWTEKEHELFEKAVVLHGWGNWSSMEGAIPTRNRTQIKSHAQKFQRHHEHVKKELMREHDELMEAHSKIEKIKAKAGKRSKEKGGTKRKAAAKDAGEAKAESKRPKRAKKPPVDTKVKAEPPKPEKKVALPKAVAESKKKPAANAATVEPKKKPAAKAVAVEPKKKPAAEPKKTVPTKTAAKKAPAKEASTSSRPKRKSAEAAAAAISAEPAAKSEPKVAGRDKPSKRKKAKPCPWKEELRAERESTPGAGSWTDAEQLQFERGCVLHGWGNWRAVEACVLTRTSEQIKSHAQKFRKHRPAEKERLEREHRLRKAKAKKRKAKASSKDAKAKAKKKAAAKKRLLPLWKNRKEEPKDKAGWTATEKKQFEDGCIFYGWGHWRDIACYIHTKSVAEVHVHANKYGESDRERLKEEHRVNYPENVSSEDSEYSEYESTVEDEVVEAKQAPTTVGQNPMKSPPPTPKMGKDDFSAAEAIVALNFANWDNRMGGAGGKAGPALPGLGGPTPTEVTNESDASSGSLDSEHKVTKDATTSEEDDDAKTETTTAVLMKAEVIKEVSTEKAKAGDAEKEPTTASTELPPAVDEVAAVSEDSNSSEESEKGVDVKSNELDAPTGEDSNSAPSTAKAHGDLAGSKASDSEDGAAQVKSAPSKPSLPPKVSSQQPPPHWLAAGTWDECMENIHKWNNELTQQERNAEYAKYDCLSTTEKELLRSKLVILMNNRPSRS